MTIYLLADYNLQGRPWSQHWSLFNYVLDPDPQCSLNMASELTESQLVTGSVRNPSGAELSLAPLWGGGATIADEGINVWDLSDIVPTDAECAGSNAIDALDLSASTEPRFIFQTYGGAGDAIARSFDLYLGRRVPCTE